MVEIMARKKIPEWQKRESVSTPSKQTKSEPNFVVQCIWKSSDRNENNFSFKKQKRQNSGTVALGYTENG